MRICSFVLLIACVVTSCNRLDIEKDAPKCIKSKIRDFNRSSFCDDASVAEYIFQGSTVYSFNPGTCGADLGGEVVDSDCKSLGFLGGISGNTEINGEEFSNATFTRMIWEK